MSRKLAVWTGALALLACGGASAWADTVQLDQQYFDSSNTPTVTIYDTRNWESFAQSFTVGLAGVFDHLDINLVAPDIFGNGSIYGSGDLIVDLLTTSSGVPTTTALSSVTLLASSLPHTTNGWVSIDFSSLALAVHVGDVYAFSIRDAGSNGVGTPAHTDIYGGTTSPTYGNGQAWHMKSTDPSPLHWTSLSTTGASADLDFRTYVLAPTPVTRDPIDNVVPLPTASWMGLGLLAGAGGIGWLKRRSRQTSL